VSIIRKGQTWSFDILLAVFVFLIIIIIVVSIIGGLTESSEKSRLAEQSEYITNALASEKDFAFIKDNKIDPEKLKDMASKDMDTLRQLLNVRDDFCLYFEDQEGNLVRIVRDNVSYYTGVGSQEARVNDINCSQIADKTAQSQAVAACGDSAINGREQCDDGNTQNNDGCSSSCRLEVAMPVCGNNKKEAGEQCDDGNNIDGDGCSANCQSESQPGCGDDIIDAGEVCDGNENACMIGGYPGTQQCNAQCVGWEACVTIGYCGDGIKSGVEQCDDGNEVSTDTCTAQCLNTVCGDGIKQAPDGLGITEECDDGNTVAGDNCGATCQLEIGCADGVLDIAAGETCDDDNQISGDGCGATCQLEVLWVFDSEAAIQSSPAIYNGKIYFGNDNGILFALNSDGTKSWENDLSTQKIIGSPAIGSDGTIYIPADSATGPLFAIRPDGSIIWSSISNPGIYASYSFQSSVAIGDDGTLFVNRDNVYGLSPSTSAIIWNSGQGTSGFSSPAIASDNTVYSADSISGTGQIYSLNPSLPAANQPRWKFDPGNSVSSSPAIGADGTVYIGSQNGKLYAFDPAPAANKQPKWELNLVGLIYASPIIGADNTIYIVNLAGSLFAINPDKSIRWQISLGSQDYYGNPSITESGLIYIGAQDGKVYGLNTDGTKRWVLTTENAIRTSPAIGPDGTIYVGSMDGKMYAIRGPSPLCASCPWPKFRHDNRNTGNYDTPLS